MDELKTIWRHLDEAPWDADSDGDKWLGPCLLARKRSYGWEIWIGQCDAGIWLGRTDDGSCFDTETPERWAPLPNPPEEEWLP
jgi:hypothetical protein